LDDLNPYIPAPDLSDAFSLPPKDIADPLVNAFFSTIHDTFPIVFRPHFLKEYEACMTSQQLPHPPRAWLASLNVVFAIGEFYLQLTNAAGQGKERHYLAYLANAQTLFFSNVLFRNPDQRQVQALGLLGIYLLATKQINRYVVLEK
jgi:hypothetical protein